MAHSYYATYHAIKGKTLVGGVKQGKTSRFGNRQDAELRLRTIIGLNNHGCKGEQPHVFPSSKVRLKPNPQGAVSLSLA